MDLMTLKVIQSFHQYPCVSILLPTHRTAPDNQKDAIRLKNLAKEAEERLRQEFDKRDIDPLVDRIHDLVATIDVQHNLDGMALYINREFAEKIDLPFSVRERVIIDHTFATRDLIMGMNRAFRYYVLKLTGKGAHLYEAYRDTLRESTANGFPHEFNPGLTEKKTEKPDNLQDGAYREFVNQVDKRFNEVYNINPMDVVTVGVVRNLALYREVADHPDRILHEVEGNYEHLSAHDLGKLVWPQVKDLLQALRHRVLDELGAAMGAKKVASGLDDVWQLSNTGRASVLVVEEGYFQPGLIDRETRQLTLVEDSKAPGVVDDVVDEIAEFVMHQGGRVVFVEDGRLAEHQRIALILRY
jgi:hypothetical protein